MEVIADTTLLIDLNRGYAPAIKFIEERAETLFKLSIITVGELSPGFRKSGYEVFTRFLHPFPIIEIDHEIAWMYGEIYLALQKKKAVIGANDLWIATTALVNKCAVVTRNIGEFSRIPNLEVLTY